MSIIGREVVGIGIVGVASLVKPTLDLPHSQGEIENHEEHFDLHDALPNTEAVVGEDRSRQPSVEDRDEHGGENENGSDPGNGFPAVPLLNGTEVAEQEHAAVEIVGSREIIFDKNPSRGAGGVDDVRKEKRSHGIG